MSLLDWFRRPSPIATLDDLDDFVDSRAAFLVQKCIFEYARARSGILSEKLFKEAAFVAAVEESRWRNYPICLGHVALMVDATLRPAARDRVAAVADGLVATVERVTGRYEVPAGFEADFWRRARRSLGERIRRASLAAPHPVRDIPKEEFRIFFDQLPIHESLRGYDFVLIRNNLRLNLCRAYEDFLKRMDGPVLIRLLASGADATSEHPVGHAAG